MVATLNTAAGRPRSVKLQDIFNKKQMSGEPWMRYNSVLRKRKGTEQKWCG
jgi:hypothetical protein